MKGIILAGGAGSRLYPTSAIYSKQLTIIYDKPMIYYPLSVLMLASIKEILIISNSETLPFYKKLFQNGNDIGLKIEYALQNKPRGLADAFIVGKKFIGSDDVTMILGDNIFYGNLNFVRDAVQNNIGATVFGYHVENPKSFGVVEFDDESNVVSIEEKPDNPKSNYAVVGLYVYNNEIVEIAENLKPSARGELEITDVNKEYLKRNKLYVKLFGRGVAWLDTGTPRTLLDASSFFGALEDRQGLKVACIEEVAYMMNCINRKQFKELIGKIPNSSYKEYLENIYNDRTLYQEYQK
ncbi:MAG: glucose-1-phosphate thymidylyltransferase RfbA [Candidatus Cloacimonetes bacterium]|nr:glucose-1-phosphate thymidylyltransferase RfbA [Candidatus Cloacimonadota bacterium]